MQLFKDGLSVDEGVGVEQIFIRKLCVTNRLGSIEKFGVHVQFENLIWPYRLTVRTKPSQGLNRGSIPRKVTKRKKTCTAAGF